MSEAEAILRESAVAAEPDVIAAFLEPWRDELVRVGLEAGPMSEWITSGLVALGLPAVSMESRQVKAALSAMVVKTDRNDARGIAQIVRTGWYKPVHVKSMDSQHARTLIARPASTSCGRWWGRSRLCAASCDPSA